MPIDLADYENKARRAIRLFWGDQSKAGGGLAAVGSERGDSGNRRSMQGFVDLIAELVRVNGLAGAEIFGKRSQTVLPGYFRATKSWDVLVMHHGVLIAAIELKSQIRPAYNNNFNLRAEEAVGSAADFWTAFREHMFGNQPRPFLGLLLLVEDMPGSRATVDHVANHFEIQPAFRGASHLERYDVLCQRLIREQLYASAALIVSSRQGGAGGEYEELSPITGLRAFVSALAGHVAAEACRLGAA